MTVFTGEVEEGGIWIVDVERKFLTAECEFCQTIEDCEHLLFS